MKKQFLFYFAHAILVLLTAITVMAADKVLETEGESSTSIADAIRQAQRSAVEAAAGVFIQSETEVSNFVLEKDKILSRSKGYITHFDILKQESAPNQYWAKIRATVSLDKIKDDLIAMKILLDGLERPTLLVLIEEDYLHMPKPRMKIAEAEINARLEAKGFELVDKAQLQQIQARNQARQALAGNVAAASSLGLAFGAQYVIMGKAVAQDVGEAYPGTGLKSIQSSITLKVIQSESGLILGSVVRNGVAAHISQLTGATKAIKDAVQRATDEYLVDAITDAFQDYLNNGVPLKMNISGVTSFRLYKQVAGEIEAIEKVVSSKKEGWNKAGGVLVLDLRYKGNSEELATFLDGRQLGDLTIEVVDLAPDRVDCILN